MSAKKLSIAGFLCLSWVIVAVGMPATDLSNTTTGSVSDGNASIPFRLFQPDNVTAGQKVPLILFLQGMGDRGTDNVSQTYWIDQLARHTRSGQFAAKILAPQIGQNMWFTGGADNQPTEAMSLTMMALQQALKDPSVDTSRVYVTGISMGAFGTWDLLKRAPNVFAAAVPMSGGGDPETAGAIKHIPIWAFHGTDDSVVPVETTRDMIAALQAAGGTPKYTEIPGAGHTIWDSVYADPDSTLYPWLFSQSLAGGADLSQLDAGFTPTFGDGIPPDGAPPTDPSVPEPTTMGLLALVGMGLLKRGRRR